MSRDIKLRLLTEQTCLKLTRRQLLGSRSVAREVIALFVAAIDHLTEEPRWTTFESLLESVQKLGRELERAGPKELVIGNIVRRVTKFLTEEYTTAFHSSLDGFIDSVPPTPGSFAQTPAGLGHRSDTQTDFFAHAANFRRQPSMSSIDEHRSGGSSPSSQTGWQTLSRAPTMFDLLGHKGPLFSPLSNELSLSEHSSQGSTPVETTPTVSPSISRAASHSLLRTFSLTRLGSTSPTIDPEEDFSKKAYRLKRVFTEAVTELLDEVESVYTDIAQQAVEHINSQEMIFTLGYSKTVETFLKTAALKRKFTVVVAETAPSYRGRQMAKALSAAKIDTVLIPDACIFALMSRVTKVIIGTHAVLADGSFFSISGTLPACRAAKAHLVPVIVCTGLYKLCPIFLGNDFAQLDEGSPADILGADEVSLESDNSIQTCNPYYDKVPSNLINLFITNAGGHPPSMCYRLLTDLYGL